MAEASASRPGCTIGRCDVSMAFSTNRAALAFHVHSPGLIMWKPSS